MASNAQILKLLNGQQGFEITGTGCGHITDYAFRHYVLGQISLVFEILALCSYGFPKCFNEVWGCDVDTDAGQRWEESIIFLQCQSEWCARHMLKCAADHHPDGFCLEYAQCHA